MANKLLSKSWSCGDMTRKHAKLIATKKEKDDELQKKIQDHCYV